MAMVDDGSPAPGSPRRLLVDDTRRALGALGRAWRHTFGARVVGITGSVGKTTTKELAASVLPAIGPVTAAPSSWNNDIGVPLTLLRAHPDDAAVVVEIGSGGPGEIAALGAIAEPDVAIITAIGRAHLGAFSGPDGIVREKAQLAASTPRGAPAIVTADSPALRRELAGRAGLITVGWSDDADVRIVGVEAVQLAGGHNAASAAMGGRDGDATADRTHADGLAVDVRRSIAAAPGVVRPVYDASSVRFVVPLVGVHHAANVAAVIALAAVMGVDDAHLAAGLLAAKPPAMRLERLRVGGVWIHDDSWNASPESMAAGLRAFHATTEPAVSAGGRRVAILGDMLELGPSAEALHADIADVIAELDRVSRFEHLVLVGSVADAYAPPGFGDRVTVIPAVDDEAANVARARLASIVRQEDHVLLKASRGIGLDRCHAWFREPAIAST